MRIRRGFFWIVLCAAVFSIFPGSLRNDTMAEKAAFYAPGPIPQNTKRTRSDYMTTLLSRNTKPLGLKEDSRLQQYLSQPAIKWAVRASRRHILN